MTEPVYPEKKKRKEKKNEKRKNTICLFLFVALKSSYKTESILDGTFNSEYPPVYLDARCFGERCGLWDDNWNRCGLINKS